MRLILCLVLLSAVVTARCQETVRVWLRNGDIVDLSFSDRPKIGFSDTGVRIGNSEVVEFDSLHKITFPVLTSDEVADSGFPHFEIIPGGVVVSNLLPGEELSVTSLSGQSTISHRADNFGMATIRLCRGVNILKVRGIAFKFAL